MIISKEHIFLGIIGAMCFISMYLLFIVYFPCGYMHDVECLIVRLVLGSTVSLVAAVISIMVLILFRYTIDCLRRRHRTNEDAYLLPDAQ